jgi:molybdopterin-guanine dinucleotide biosynthesis protein B
MHELRGAAEPSLNELIGRLAPCDLVLVEGFKREPSIPRLEVHRAHTSEALLFPADAGIIGVASDVAVATHLPQFRLDDIEPIALFILRHVGLAASPARISRS